MQGLPLIVFPSGAPTQKGPRGGRGATYNNPGVQRQSQRLGRKFRRLQTAIEERRAEVAESALGIRPEKVLVLETVGPIENFAGAVRRSGLEWLFEWDEDGIEPDDDFFNLKDPNKPLGGRLFLSMADSAALDQLLGLWRSWQRGEDLAWGFGKWANLFSQLKDVRYWAANDRLSTGIVEYWRSRVEDQVELVRFEVELWYREKAAVRGLAAQQTRQLITDAGGETLSESLIQEIAYHALMAQVPADRLPDFIQANEENIQLLRADEVMYFRPVGQCLVETEEGDSATIPPPDPVNPNDLGPPVVALLDGAPLAQHQWLSDYIEIDDPDNWSDAYAADERRHGTAMASLIINGDRGVPQGRLNSKLYARPILKPDHDSFQRPRPESVPSDQLPIDLVHRAVVRLFEGTAAEPPAAPTVRIINLSVGDPNQLFYRTVSAWARLLDWMSWKYDTVFVVSAGNHDDSIELHVSTDDFLALDADDQRTEFLRGLRNVIPNRRLISPSESINAITVGAIHADFSVGEVPPHLLDIVGNIELPSPLNPIGTGHRRSIKPEMNVAAGRLWYEPRIGRRQEAALLDPVRNLAPPGQLAAIPGRIAGRLNEAGYTVGTSNAAAAASRAGAIIFDEVIRELDIPDSVSQMERRHEACLIKTLLTHGCSWGNAEETMADAIDDLNTLDRQSLLSAFLGYGSPDLNRVLGCTDQRITLVAWGDLGQDSALLYGLPLPPALIGSTHERRLTITLGWITPCNMQNQRYRRAALWVDPPAGNRPDNVLRIDRNGPHWQAVRRGTLQHEVMVGARALDYSPDSNLAVRVNCAKDAGALDIPIPFGLAVTLEVAEGLQIPIYNQVSARVQEQLAVRV